MAIQFTKVTWYSKLLAVVLYVGIFCWGFNLGLQYKEVSASQNLDSIRTADAKGNVLLGVGETGRFGQLKITFNALVQDSRCPVDVQCIQAGAVNTNVTFALGDVYVSKNMPSDEVPQEFMGYKISIVKVMPERRSGKEISLNSYNIIFHIESMQNSKI